MYELKNKVVLVTGAANGIGSSVVKCLLEEGVAAITILDVENEAGIETKNRLNKKYGNKVNFIHCDVSIEEQLFGAFETIKHEHGYIDIVINNAGLVDESRPDLIRKEIEVNYLAIVNGTLKALELMRKDQGGRGGTVVNVSSIASLCQVSPSLFVYMGTKSAVMQFSNCIGREQYHSKTGVRIITVCFGNTNTDIVNKMKSFDDIVNNDLENIKKIYPMQSPESAARGLVYSLINGDSGSTWLVNNNKPALDVTQSVNEAYALMGQHLLD